MLGDLKRYIMLDSKIAIYVPSQYGDGRAIPEDVRREWVSRVASSFSSWFGGATATAAAGYWVSERLGLISEDVVIVYARAESDGLRAHIHDALQLAHAMREALHQEAVSLEVNNEFYLIDGGRG